MKITDVFFSIKTDLSVVGLIRNSDFPHYFCTPKNAVIFSDLGVDGIHFCIIPNANDLTLEHSPIYVISPTLSHQHLVMVVAEDFRTFLELVISIKDAGALECISYVTEARYTEYLNDIPSDHQGIDRAVETLTEVFKLKKVSDVYGYVKKLQENMDLSQIEFSKEYYEIVG